jgi:hypothetical protein
MTYGYDKLASLIGDYPGLSIYRRFGSLAAKNLLYMQAELVQLEDELKTIAECDHQDPRYADLGTSWEALRNAPKNGARDLQRQKFLEIRAKITEYCPFPPRFLLISPDDLHNERYTFDADCRRSSFGAATGM